MRRTTSPMLYFLLGWKLYFAPHVAEGHEPVRRPVPLPRAWATGQRPRALVSASCTRYQEEEHGGQRFVAPRTGQQVTTQTAPRVGNLVVVLEEGHKRRRLQPKGRGAAALLLPCVALSLV